MPHAISGKPHRVVIVLDPTDVRAWQIEVVRRLEAAGHTVGTKFIAASDPATHRLDMVLNLEARRFGASLASRTAPLPTGAGMDERELTIDLTGSLMPQAGAPVLHLQFNGQRRFADGLTQIIASGSLPEITAFLDGAPVGLARPMLSDRLWLSRASNEVLSGAIGLVEQLVARFFAGAITAVAAPEKANPVRGFWRHYVPALARSVALRVYQKLRTRRPFYWQVAYRPVDGADVAATTALDGAPFSILPDDNKRFYADPFVVTHQGKTFLFVEEYPYATARGVISVAEQQSDGSFGVPQVVIEEPYHLSYPQVFAHEGDMFMLPESGGARRLVLYRATAFPDQWVADTVLIEGRDINDATLLERDGKFWLFATERRGAGSASDTMVVFAASDLRGPWSPHKLNPIAIDCAASRPGGGFIARDGRTFLPVQDGTTSYGGGLALMELLQLDDDAVVFAPPVPIRSGTAWPVAGIHTLNKSGRVEVVDSAG